MLKNELEPQPEAEHTQATQAIGPPARRLQLLLIAPLAAMALILYLPALLAGIMASDTGTKTAIALSLSFLAAIHIYLGMILGSIMLWYKKPKLAALMLTLIALINAIVILIQPKIAVVLGLAPLAVVGVLLPNAIQHSAGLIIFGTFAVVAPLVGVALRRR